VRPRPSSEPSGRILARIVPSSDALTNRASASAPRAREAAEAGVAPVEEAAATPPRRGIVLAFLMTTMALGSIEGTIVATAMPSIVSALGGFELYSWVFASYLLTQAVFTPISGGIADRLGR